MTDFDACWDAVVDVELNAYEKGVTEGRGEADHESRTEGHRAGFLRGYALGLEVGFVHDVRPWGGGWLACLAEPSRSI